MRATAMAGAVGLAAVLAACDGARDEAGNGGAERAPVAESRWREGEVTPGSPRVRLDTSKGDILLALHAAESPQTVENFLAYVREGFYDGLVFHRVIPGFMVQAGGFTPALEARKPTRPPIRNEATNELANLRGTVAMARTEDPHSASAQFFINQVENELLNQEARGPGEWGYAVFGRVVEGLDVVDAIASLPTGTRSGPEGPMQDVPLEPVAIRSARVVE